MDLLFKREQTTGKLARVNFKLWGKIELDEEEAAIVKRYRFDEAMLITAEQPELLKQAAIFGVGVLIISMLLLTYLFGLGAAIPLSLLAGGGGAYWWYNEKRETIFVKDLLHGRHFTCASVIDLAKKEAWLTGVVGFLRQVMESAKHWDGTERHHILPLPPELARSVIV